MMQVWLPMAPVVTDNCPTGLTVVNDAPAKFPLGKTLVTWTAKDTSGNAATATQLVTAELGDDPSCCPDGTTIRVGTAASDALIGTSGSDCILGLGGNDRIIGQGGNDFISGGDGNDVIISAGGDDTIFGGPGNDMMNTGRGTNFINGGPGTDRCNLGPGNNTIVNCE